MHTTTTRSSNSPPESPEDDMSSITIATLPRMSRDALSALLLGSTPSKLAIIDVRDSDHVGGHIYSSTWVPSSSLDVRLPELIRTLQDKEKVVFHCALSQQRGPSAALRYARERERVLGPEESQKQEVYVLEGGFVQWQEKYGKDVRLTEAYAEDIWREY
ncbi:Rhodanese-like domain-containing protein [Aspergillus ambiguus]|uniref:phosphatase YCH1 n=1 Tax=Aspergillus ambiguus TaxID=176160 RepID=UPI003CCD8FA6